MTEHPAQMRRTIIEAPHTTHPKIVPLKILNIMS